MQYFSCCSDKYTEIKMCDLEPFSKIQSNILFCCATGLGPNGDDTNDVIGDMYHNNILLTDQVCNGFVTAQGVGNVARFPGLYQAPTTKNIIN